MLRAAQAMLDAELQHTAARHDRIARSEFDDVISKPFSVQRLIDTLEQFCDSPPPTLQ